jgi:hypothetical protein
MYTFFDKDCRVDIKAAAVTRFDAETDGEPALRILSGESFEHGEVVAYLPHVLPNIAPMETRDGSGLPAYHVTIPEMYVVPKPADVTHEVAVFGLAYGLQALGGLFYSLKLLPEESLLVIGAEEGWFAC